MLADGKAARHHKAFSGEGEIPEWQKGRADAADAVLREAFLRRPKPRPK
jgi:hypothetical protein